MAMFVSCIWGRVAGMRRFLFSIRPIYARGVLSGTKRWELRRGALDSLSYGDVVFLYVSGREQKIEGLFRVGRIFRGGPEDVWRFVSSDPLSGITYDAWQYIAGSRRAAAIEVRDPCVFSRQPSLREIRAVFPRWSPPLSYAELKREEPLYVLFLEDLFEECAR